MLRLLIAAVGSAVLVVPAVTAPAAKTKPESLGPPTAEQFQAAEENLKQFGLAWHNYHDTYGQFPTNQVSKDGKPLLSWRVQILPFIEHDALYKEFKLDEPWDSKHNKKLIDKMPKIFAPVRGRADPGVTFYQAFTGKNGLFRSGDKLGLFGITDGTSNTIMVVEAAKPVVWTKPDDLEFSGKDVPAVGGMFDGKFHVVMCDGAVYRLKKGVDPDVMRRLIGPRDGEVVSVNDAVDSDGDKK